MILKIKSSNYNGWYYIFGVEKLKTTRIVFAKMEAECKPPPGPVRIPPPPSVWNEREKGQPPHWYYPTRDAQIFDFGQAQKDCETAEEDARNEKEKTGDEKVPKSAPSTHAWLITYFLENGKDGSLLTNTSAFLMSEKGDTSDTFFRQ